MKYRWRDVNPGDMIICNDGKSWAILVLGTSGGAAPTFTILTLWGAMDRFYEYTLTAVQGNTPVLSTIVRGMQ